MKRTRLRIVLIVALLLSTGLAAWTTLRPYEWSADPVARCRMDWAEVTKDNSFYWVKLHLKVARGQTHDLMKPVRLLTRAGRELEPADTTLGGIAEKGTTDLWFKFWLEKSDLEGPLSLRINDGMLVIKSNPGMPELGRSDSEYFTTHHW